MTTIRNSAYGWRKSNCICVMVVLIVIISSGATFQNQSLTSWTMVQHDIVSVTDNDASQGYILSPNYPGQHPIESHSIATLHVLNDDQHDTVRLTFVEMSLDLTNNCEYDAIKIFIPNENDAALYPDRNVFIACGSKPLLPLDIMAKNVVVQLTTDEFVSTTGGGFKLKFEFINSQAASRENCNLSNQFKCRNRKCIAKELVCNHFDDCGDASDEDITTPCPNLPTIHYDTNYKCGLASFAPLSPAEATTSGRGLAQFLLQNRIVGGDKAAVSNRWLPLVSIQSTRIEPLANICGGVLIHPMFVLSSAHCFGMMPDVANFRLMFGLQDLRYWDAKSVQVRYASAISIYPSLWYRIQDVTETNFERANNLALIELNAPVRLNSNVWPACLPHLDEVLKVGRECIAAGYGETRGSGFAFALKKVKQVVKHGTECRSQYSQVNINDHDMICAESEPDNGPCNGDSGGPLMCRDGPDNEPIGLSEFAELDGSEEKPGELIKYLTFEDEDESGAHEGDESELFAKPRRARRGQTRFTVHGITSFTTDGNVGGGYCGLKGVPVIHGRVSTRIEWILSVMRLAFNRLNLEDRQLQLKERAGNGPMFGYLFRSGFSQHPNFTRPMSVFAN